MNDLEFINIVHMKNEEYGEISDGYHTFNELYDHRTMLLAALTRLYFEKHPTWVYKSKLHDSGDMFDGYFIVGIYTPEGWVTYHQSLEWWDVFNIPEWAKSPAYDGHTPQDCLDRLKSLCF